MPIGYGKNSTERENNYSHRCTKYRHTELYLKTKLPDKENQISTSATVIVHLNTPLSEMDRSSRKKRSINLRPKF